MDINPMIYVIMSYAVNHKKLKYIIHIQSADVSHEHGDSYRS